MTTRRWMRDAELCPPSTRPAVAVAEPRWLWWVPERATEAHAYPAGSGWMRSTCEARHRWTVKARQATNEDIRCPDCVRRTREQS